MKAVGHRDYGSNTFARPKTGRLSQFVEPYRSRFTFRLSAIIASQLLKRSADCFSMFRTLYKKNAKKTAYYKINLLRY